MQGRGSRRAAPGAEAKQRASETTAAEPESGGAAEVGAVREVQPVA